MSRWTNPHYGVSHLCDLPVGIQATVEVFDEQPQGWTQAYVLSRSSTQPFTPIAERMFDELGHTDAAKLWLEEWVRPRGVGSPVFRDGAGVSRRRDDLDGEAGYGDERMFESSPKLRIKPYHDCPTCPYCGSRAGVGAAAYGQTDPKTLKCLCCGEYFQGTEEQVEQARRADLAWDRREDNERGPRSVVLRRRRRREINQLSLAWTDQVVASKEDSGDDR